MPELGPAVRCGAVRCGAVRGRAGQGHHRLQQQHMQRTASPSSPMVGVGVSSRPEEVPEVPLPLTGWLPLPLPLPACRACRGRCRRLVGLITPK
jgi:hypothetical protein